jgi:uncharacterized protein (DUF952 family)
MESFIYHVTTRKEWNNALQENKYEAASLPIEGFIHCRTQQQVAGVLQRYFSGKTNLVKLVIDPSKLVHELKYELAPSIKEEFPHVYGTINIDAVIEVINL